MPEATSSIPATSRRQQVPEEDATKLQFGEFADGEALTLTEVATLLVYARSVAGVPPAPDNKVYQSTSEYVNEFSSTSMEVSDAMRNALSANVGFLNKFEIAQIMSLRPEKVEVAVALIPSLERYAQGDESEEQLQSLLDEVRGIVRYGVQP
ncbi:hypothetical protein L202_06502 [Cryptococcus amylolentus CBS 6039]|uniref:RNA polymerase Rpb4/RPC9 core domain-containing protein n=1 Tax=Cryptococcus amylolentus CBS 6039 TaxID=1295533 RepID=A0A1E3HHU8_9TREE|nr:hypothetical protein L202_06502 [Cryptococcus amylolentus CBS 6039]ODN75326.1 hypothetical protein L202_06502 [Cryptococcus amylolentus CBS 6039]